MPNIFGQGCKLSLSWNSVELIAISVLEQCAANNEVIETAKNINP